MLEVVGGPEITGASVGGPDRYCGLAVVAANPLVEPDPCANDVEPDPCANDVEPDPCANEVEPDP